MPGNKNIPAFNLGCKIWLEKDGLSFGEGLFKLLSGVAGMGSISRAAADANMSYRAAWGKIKEAERRWGVKLVHTRVGGETGGGTVLTHEGVELLKKYEMFRHRAELAVKELFIDIFKQ